MRKVDKAMRIKSFIPEKMLCKSSKYVLGYKRGILVIRDIYGKKVIQKFRIHGVVKSLVLVERLLRYEPRAAYALADNIFIYSDHGSIYEYHVETNSQKVVHSFSRGMNNPLSFCARKDENGKLIELVYGEYIWNTDKGPVSIYKYIEGMWKEVYQFPEHIVMHIHNIVYDKYRKQYVILTGDEDNESALWLADTDFCDVKMLIGGKQKYRACVAFPVQNGIYYATDTPLEQNWIYYYEYTSEKLRKIFPMPGPCIYGNIYEEKLYLATSVEGNPTLGKWKYRLSNKLGVGVYDRNVHIIKCTSEGSVEEVGQFTKDKLPMWLFQFGNALFPSAEDGVYISTQSTKEKGTYKLVEDGI